VGEPRNTFRREADQPTGMAGLFLSHVKVVSFKADYTPTKQV